MKHRLMFFFAFLAFPLAAHAQNAGSAGFHLLTTETRTSTEHSSPLSSKPRTCDKKNLGAIYEEFTPNGSWKNLHLTLDGTYTVKKQLCAWGDQSLYVTDTYPVTRGGEQIHCPVVKAGPFTAVTPIWPPRPHAGLSVENQIYCTRPS